MDFFSILASINLSTFEWVICVLFTFILLTLLRNISILKRVTRQDDSTSRQVKEFIDDENKQIKERLSNLTQAFNIRSEHLNESIKTQIQTTQQEGSQYKNLAQQQITALKDSLYQHQQGINKNQNEQLFQLQKLISNQLLQQSEGVKNTVSKLTESTEHQLKEISEKVSEKLEKNITNTHSTFTAIQNRLAVIDQAQKNIDGLSHSVSDLTHLLLDKKARGAFGEVQLQTIIENALPKQFVSFQYTLSNNKRADCIIHLPEPNGDMVIDAKFPLESYKKITEPHSFEINPAIQTFKKDIKKHIVDIASKYINPPETAESAILFLPAEAIFAEINSNHPELITFAQQQQVWITSPTTLMAVLATAKTVIKDNIARKQSKVIREQLHLLGKDFQRFQERMESLAKNIEKANENVTQVNISANKINSQFKKIESSQFGNLSDNSE